MSAFLFVYSDKSIKQMSTEEIKEQIKHIEEKELKDLNWDEYQMCNYKWDRASGMECNLAKLKFELENRELGKDDPFPRILIPGFNPPVED